MLFRTNTGELVEIKKYNHSNDKLYYDKIMEIKKKLSKLEKIHDTSNNTLKGKNHQ
jgi:hypothetical protein